ncbi:hypothetical protein QYF61_019553 [Mycteria americana]|uniref:Uncharacterized protein n=1 Tax=Mycteria americana TaxID=33587 RepID=A0AAN7NDC3_MYCAM|nr:hypothetical protein QYF61_019553 [Mycteria americana]
MQPRACATWQTCFGDCPGAPQKQAGALGVEVLRLDEENTGAEGILITLGSKMESAGGGRRVLGKADRKMKFCLALCKMTESGEVLYDQKSASVRLFFQRGKQDTRGESASRQPAGRLWNKSTWKPFPDTQKDRRTIGQQYRLETVWLGSSFAEKDLDSSWPRRRTPGLLCTRKGIDILEQVQQRAAKMIRRLEHMAYSVGGYKEDGARIVRDAQQKDKRQESHFIKTIESIRAPSQEQLPCNYDSDMDIGWAEARRDISLHVGVRIRPSEGNQVRHSPGMARQGHRDGLRPGRTGQGCGELETSPAAASLGQGLTSLGV